jgi:hypothetical protein
MAGAAKGGGGVLGFELRALTLPGRSFAIGAMPPAFFALVTFQIGFCIYAWTNHNPPIYTFQSSWDDRCSSPRPSWWRWHLSKFFFFCLCWPQTTTLLMSASQVIRIMGMSHWAWLGSATLLFFAVLGFELRAYTLSYYASSPHPPFVMGFSDRVSQTICPGWL